MKNLGIFVVLSFLVVSSVASARNIRDVVCVYNGTNSSVKYSWWAPGNLEMPATIKPGEHIAYYVHRKPFTIAWSRAIPQSGVHHEGRINPKVGRAYDDDGIVTCHKDVTVEFEYGIYYENHMRYRGILLEQQ